MGKGLCLLSGKASCSPGHGFGGTSVTLCCDALGISVPKSPYPFPDPVPPSPLIWWSSGWACFSPLG